MVRSAETAEEVADRANDIPALSEIIVTATRRAENLRDVPIAIQAFTPDTMRNLNVSTLDDAIKYLPNVTTSSVGPGQSNIYMRGLAASSTQLQAAGYAGTFPNVAVYLDDQSGQLPGRNLDVYAADLERIEVLEGPQGTLFGAGAQAGVVRYITNKPKLNVYEANFNAGYGITAGGDPNTNIDATVNLPLIDDRLAVRAVFYNDKRGGYIDNRRATFERLATDQVVPLYFNGVLPPNSGPINNYNTARDNFNPVTYQGVRGSALLKINDDWNGLLVQSYQTIDSDGVFWEEQYDATGKTLPPLSVELFNPNYNKDKFENTALTLNGRIGALSVVYAGAYLVRNIESQTDYTNYSRARYSGYYQCTYPGYPFTKQSDGSITGTPGSSGYCWSPSSFYQERSHTTHQSHELRLSTPGDWRLRGLAGAFFEKYNIAASTNWFFESNPNFNQVGPPTLDPATGELHPTTTSDPGVRPPTENFFNDITRGYEQKALFTSVDFDLIPKVLTLTAGTRYYDITTYERGAQAGSFGCQNYGAYTGIAVPKPCVSTPATGVLSNINNLDAAHLRKSYVGFKSRGNISWRVTPDAMVYYTWSQGFRAGGFNRSVATISSTSPLYGIFSPPIAYAPDTLTNNEIGWKTSWLAGRLQFDGAVYQEDWKNTQISIFDPGVTGLLAFLTNGPNYRVRGVETTVSARIARGLTVSAGASWNHSEIVKTLNLTTPATGQPINIVNPFGAMGSPLAQSPPFQGNIRARYEVPLGDYLAFAQVGATHQAHSYASTDQLSKTLQGDSIAFDQKPFTTYQASLGVSKDVWTVTLFGDNLSNSRSELFSSYSNAVKAVTVDRPRTLGIKVNYKLGGSK